MAALYSHTTRSTGTTLTAAIYNADHENHITNGIPTQLDDYSVSESQMQTATSPGSVGSPSLATSLAGELERLRYVIRTLHGGAQWYPGATLAQTLSSVAGTNTITAAAGAAYTYSTTGLVTFIPANTNTGATTLNITPSGASALGAKNIFWDGAACVGGELRASVPVMLYYDGTQFHVVASGFHAFPDTLPIVVGGTDATKKVRFEVDGLTTATTRVLTVQDSDQTLVGRTTADTLTNKTLTAPAFNGAITGDAIATQAEQETGTDVDNLVSSGRQHFHPSAAKGWVKYAGASGTVAGSYNVASVTNNGTGDETVNWATDFSTTNYAVVFTSSSFRSALGTIAAGTTQILTFDSLSAAEDAASVHVIAFGDHA